MKLFDKYRIRWEKEETLYFLLGGLFTGGIIFEGIARFMKIPLGRLIALILFLIALIIYIIIFKKQKKKK